jgi:hypothetical protein
MRQLVLAYRAPDDIHQGVPEPVLPDHVVARAAFLQLVRGLCIRFLNDDSKPFHILVDQIERVWSNDQDSDAMVVGLFLASKHIRQFFNFVICTLFVRTDIYEKLQFQDRDKFRGDEFHIEWDKQKLIELIGARASVSIGHAINRRSVVRCIFCQDW